MSRFKTIFHFINKEEWLIEALLNGLLVSTNTDFNIILLDRVDFD